MLQAGFRTRVCESQTLSIYPPYFNRSAAVHTPHVAPTSAFKAGKIKFRYRWRCTSKYLCS